MSSASQQWGPQHDTWRPPELPGQRKGWIGRAAKAMALVLIYVALTSVDPGLQDAVNRSLAVVAYGLWVYIIGGVTLTVAARRWDLTARALSGGLLGALIAGVIIHMGAGVTGLGAFLGVAVALPRRWMWATLREQLDGRAVWPVISRLAGRNTRACKIQQAWTPSQAIATRMAAGGGVLLGADDQGAWTTANPEHQVLVIGPPRSGKTSGVIIPTILSAGGAVLTTSTKPDVMRATIAARAELGQAWIFDPLRRAEIPAGARRLEWTPVAASREWDDALRMARAMCDGAGVGGHVEEASHWRSRARDLLAPLLFAEANVADGSMQAVTMQIFQQRTSEAQTRLLGLPEDRARMALAMLAGFDQLSSKERGSIFSAAADACTAYITEASTLRPDPANWDPARWVRSCDTIYVVAPSAEQQMVAPLTCALIDEIARQTYLARGRGELPQPIELALDEVANIAPLHGLPAMASEGGSQGLRIIACLQDLSQARDRWQERADGFLTLFGSKLILNGIQDSETLEAISVTLGEYDRRKVTHSQNVGEGEQHLGGLLAWFTPRSESAQTGASSSITTERQRILTPGDISHLPDGRALAINAKGWQLVWLQPAHSCEPWRSLTQLAAPIQATGVEL